MQQSRRARRMERRHKRGKGATLHLVSMMDIFTILVFFMLVNTSGVQEVSATRAVKLPESVAETAPRETPIVMVTADELLLQDAPIATLDAVNAHADGIFPPLKLALEQQAARALAATGEDKGEVTVMADKEIPYALLRKIMATCTAAGFTQVSLAVIQKEG